MGDLGLDMAYGAQGSSDAMQQIFERRMALAASQRQQQQLEQNDALTRLKIQEHADEIRQNLEGKRQAEKDRVEASKAAEEDRQNKQAQTTFTMNPVGANLGPTQGPRAQQLGFPVSQIAGPKVQQTTGFMPLPSAPPQGPGMQAMGDLSPVGGPPPAGPQIAPGASSTAQTQMPDTFQRGATQADVVKQREDEQAAGNQDWKNSIAQELATLKEGAGQKVPQQHFSPLPQFDEKGNPIAPMAFDLNTGTARPIPGVGANRAAPGAAANAQHDRTNKETLDTLSQLDQAIDNAKDLIGPGQGRISNLEQMAGSADPRIQALGVKMKAAKMRVDHAVTGSVRAGASPMMMAQWDNILANKVTPEGLKAGVQAMREIIGGGAATAPSGSGPKVGDTKTFPNGATAVYDGQGWVKQ